MKPPRPTQRKFAFKLSNSTTIYHDCVINNHDCVINYQKNLKLKVINKPNY